MKHEQTEAHVPARVLPDEDCWCSILQCLKDEPATLCRCAEVCFLFYNLCGSDTQISEDLWKGICERRWERKMNKKVQIGKRAQARQSQFLRLALNNGSCPAHRKESAEAGLEHASSHRDAHLLTLATELTPQCAHFASCNLSSCCSLGNACCAGCLPSLWKLSYYEAEWDSKRATLTLEELTSYLWHFQFLQYPSPYLFVSRYNPDFTYESSIFSIPLPWRLVSGSSLQVDAYPVLEASRNLETWGWSLENAHVRMDQMDIPASRYHEWASPSGMDLSDASVMYADEDGFLDEWGVEYGDGVGFH